MSNRSSRGASRKTKHQRVDKKTSLVKTSVQWPLSVMLLAASASSFAQPVEQQMGEVVVSASGFEQDVKEAPASITVITREDLETKRITSIADALADVEGIDIGGGAGKTGGLNIRMRGLENDYTLILIDGRRQNSTANLYPNGFGEAKNSFLPPTSAIERIEVIRGPMSTLYGSDAMGGVVNIITRKVAKEWTGSVSVDGTFLEDSKYGNSNAAELFLSGPIKDDTLGLQLRARNWKRAQSDLTYLRDDGTESDELTQGRNPTKASQESYGARLTFTPTKDHDLWIDLDTSNQTYDNSKEQLGTLGAAGGYGPIQKYSREKMVLAHNWRTGSGILESSLSYNETESQGRLIPERLTGRSGDRQLTSEDFIFDTKYVTALGNHTLSVGAQYWDAEMRDGILPQATKFTQISAFLEDEWRLRDDLALTIGVRHDDHDTFGGYTTPRAYLVWNANDNWTFKGGASKGYKAPRLEYLTNGIYTVTGQGRTPAVGNPDLKPETSVSTEIGAIYDNLQGFSTGLTFFKSDYKDFIDSSGDMLMACRTATQQADCEAFLLGFGSAWDIRAGDAFDLNRPTNVDKASIQGAELFSRWQVNPAWSIAANYTYTDSELETGDYAGDPVNDTPAHMANLLVRWKASEKLSTWLRAEFRSEAFRKDTNRAGTERYRDLVGDWKPYNQFHLGGIYSVSKNLTLSATVFNLLDKNFRESTNIGGTDYAKYRNNFESRRFLVTANYAF